MTEQEAIEQLKKMNNSCALCGNTIFEDCERAKSMAIKALEKQINGGWIPCSERLPNVTTCIGYIPYSDDFGNELYEINIVTYFGSNEYREGIFKDSWNNEVHVKAWQPLPPQYKEGE